MLCSAEKKIELRETITQMSLLPQKRVLLSSFAIVSYRPTKEDIITKLLQKEKKTCSRVV